MSCAAPRAPNTGTAASAAVAPGLHRGTVPARDGTAPDALVSHVSAALRRMVADGRASESLLCERLSMPRRTLHRKLAAQGTSVRRLLEEVRYEFARQLLLDTDLTTAGVAAALDYADASAFNRAFRRWTDTTPAAWRARAAAASSAGATRARGHPIR